MSSVTGTETLKSFVAAYGRGDVDGAVATFHPRAEIQTVRKSTHAGKEVYGR